MAGEAFTPKVFISYSWTDKMHQEWVLQFASRLLQDGIQVILDKWDLKEGHDKHRFMEQMVTDPDIQKVLVICDKSYQQKADKRSGGVGTETQLISKEVYEKVEQEKFIPIVREFENGQPCIPKYMASRIFIDLSNEAEYENLYVVKMCGIKVKRRSSVFNLHFLNNIFFDLTLFSFS